MNFLFDFGGVLVDLDRQRCIEAFAEINFDVKPYLGTYAQAGLFSKLERGVVSIHEFCDELRGLSEKKDLPDEAIVHAWEQYLIGVPENRLEMLLKIGQHYPVHVLSNTNEIHWAIARERFFRYRGHTIRDFFNEIFLSCELGVEKPAPQIYQAVVERLACPPDEILFLDDCEENCVAAQQAGLQARLAPAGGKWLEFFTPDGYYI
ncbi:D-ribitol-5-phosphate phosphatase [Bacteroidaceae bacterium]|uniref:HAD family hydrolase n=1 Tax=Prevotella sp. MGM2 TaxID=2033406 RepID=UPI000CE9D330|nr:HAD family phosphatase [Prevotella sp. MGM2]GAY30945.1 haloacid dehalogenase-type hydrolase [Prevotella sp. MGM2]GFI35324.1 D-ribitol-5-phosphate phosphatase [Bacteroidaceae bacterium]